MPSRRWTLRHSLPPCVSGHHVRVAAEDGWRLCADASRRIPRIECRPIGPTNQLTILYPDFRSLRPRTTRAELSSLERARERTGRGNKETRPYIGSLRRQDGVPEGGTVLELRGVLTFTDMHVPHRPTLAASTVRGELRLAPHEHENTSTLCSKVVARGVQVVLEHSCSMVPPAGRGSSVAFAPSATTTRSGRPLAGQDSHLLHRRTSSRRTQPGSPPNLPTCEDCGARNLTTRVPLVTVCNIPTGSSRSS